MTHEFVDHSQSIGRSSSKIVVIPVHASQSVSWKLKLDNHDIGFQVEFRPGRTAQSEDQSTEQQNKENETHRQLLKRPFRRGRPDPDSNSIRVQLMLRLNADTNIYTPNQEGEVQFTLDNSYSMFRSKKVNFQVAVVENTSITEDILATSSLSVDDTEEINEAATIGVDMFFRNQFDEAEEYFARNKNRFTVFSLAYAALSFLRAMMTWAPEDMAQASDRLDHTKLISATHLPKDSLISSIGRAMMRSSSSNDKLNSAQVEARLVQAEVHLVRSLLHLLDESLLGFVRCGLSVRTGWKLYNQCDEAVNRIVSKLVNDTAAATFESFKEQEGEHTEQDIEAAAEAAQASAELGAQDDTEAEGAEEDDEEEGDTASHALGMAEREQLLQSIISQVNEVVPGVGSSVVGGIQFGLGSFNLILSVMPPILLRIVQALGFPSKRSVGLKHLNLCMSGEGVRSPLAALMMLTYHIILPSFLSSELVQSHHNAAAQEIVDKMLCKYEESALFLWLAGRLDRTRTSISEAINKFERCALCQDSRRQLKHLCAYELGWCHVFSLNWSLTLPFFRLLELENTWSKTFYAYMVSASYAELGDSQKAVDCAHRALREQSRALAGKRLSIEQFVVRRADEITVALQSKEPMYYAIASMSEQLNMKRKAEVDRLMGASGNRSAGAIPEGDESMKYAISPMFSVLPGIEMAYLFNGFAQMEAKQAQSCIQAIDSLLLVLCGYIQVAFSPHVCLMSMNESGNLDQLCAVSKIDPTAQDSDADKILLHLFNCAVSESLQSDPESEMPQHFHERCSTFVSHMASAVLKLVETSAENDTDGQSSTSNRLAPDTTSVRSTLESMKCLQETGDQSSECKFTHALTSSTVHNRLEAIALAALCRAAACARLGMVTQAKASIDWILSPKISAQISRDKFIIPFAYYEKAVLCGPGDTAVEAIRAAKGFKSDFNLKYRLHMRLHLLQNEYKRAKPVDETQVAAVCDNNTSQQQQIANTQTVTASFTDTNTTTVQMSQDEKYQDDTTDNNKPIQSTGDLDKEELHNTTKMQEEQSSAAGNRMDEPHASETKTQDVESELDEIQQQTANVDESQEKEQHTITTEVKSPEKEHQIATTEGKSQEKEQQTATTESKSPEKEQQTATTESKPQEMEQQTATAESKSLEMEQQTATTESKPQEKEQQTATTDAASQKYLTAAKLSDENITTMNTADDKTSVTDRNAKETQQMTDDSLNARTHVAVSESKPTNSISAPQNDQGDGTEIEDHTEAKNKDNQEIDESTNASSGTDEDHEDEKEEQDHTKPKNQEPDESTNAANANATNSGSKKRKGRKNKRHGKH